jgi:WD40 repeat protein
VQAVAFGPQGALVAATELNHRQGTGATDGHLAVWRAATGALVASPLDLGQPGDSVGFSPSGTQLAVGVLDRGPALIVDPSSGRIRRTLQPLGSADQEPIISLAFAPDGTLATGSWAGIVQLWNAANGRTVGHPVLAESCASQSPFRHGIHHLMMPYMML